MLGKVYLGPRVSNLDTGDPAVRISRVNLQVDSEHYYTAGDDSGRTIEKTCPWGTQAMADSILASLRYVDYRPYSGLDGLLDPAAEVGDGITVGDTYSTLAQTDILFDCLCTADVSAPGGDEVEDEYPYKSRARRQADRELAQTRSMILKTAEAITLRVENQLKAVYAEIVVELDGITSEVQGLDGAISSVRQYADKIAARVTDLNGTVEVTLDTLNGLTVKDASGETRIKGSSIDTPSLLANSISADKLDLTGSITFSDLTRSLRNDINDAYSMAEDAQDLANDLDDMVGGWVYEGTAYMDGRMLMIGTVTASTLEGGEVYLLDYYGRRAGSFTLEGASSYYGQKVVMDSGAIEINSQYGSLYLEGGSGGWIEINSMCEFGADIGSGRSGKQSCGTPDHLWTDIYAVNGEIQTSDRNKKTGINYDIAAYDALFDALRPVSYRFIDGQSGRTHLGLIAQDVEQALAGCGLTGMDFAGLIKSPRLDETGQVIEGEYDYALRYGEFIPLCIRRIQALTARVAELERRLTS